MSISKKELAAMKALAERATPGPWSNQEEMPGYPDARQVVGAGRRIALCNTRDGASDRVDAEFIAHAREDVPRLLAEVERLSGIVGHLLDEPTGIMHIRDCAKCDDIYEELESKGF